MKFIIFKIERIFLKFIILNAFFSLLLLDHFYNFLDELALRHFDNWPFHRPFKKPNIGCEPSVAKCITTVLLSLYLMNLLVANSK